MIRDPRRPRKLRIFTLVSLTILLLVSVALFGFGLHPTCSTSDGRPPTD